MQGKENSGLQLAPEYLEQNLLTMSQPKLETPSRITAQALTQSRLPLIATEFQHS